MLSLTWVPISIRLINLSFAAWFKRETCVCCSFHISHFHVCWMVVTDMGVFSWLHYLTYAKKTKLVDFHYKSLKSWKINNSDLTQQFKLSIFTDFYRLTASGVNNSLQVLQGTLVAGQEKKRELATTSLEFEYLHQKNWSKKLIGGDDISYVVNTLGSCLHMFFIVCLHSRSFQLRTD